MSNKLSGIKILTIFFAMALLIPAMGFTLSEKQDLPGLVASTNKKSYNPGESGVLILNFKTGSHVKIPKDPEVTIKLTSNDVEGQGLQDYSGEEGDYISNSKVKYNFTVPADAASGSMLTISGNVKFGYCSSVDGVCKLGNKNFSTKIKVK